MSIEYIILIVILLLYVLCCVLLCRTNAGFDLFRCDSMSFSFHRNAAREGAYHRLEEELVKTKKKTENKSYSRKNIDHTVIE